MSSGDEKQRKMVVRFVIDIYNNRDVNTDIQSTAPNYVMQLSDLVCLCGASIGFAHQSFLSNDIRANDEETANAAEKNLKTLVEGVLCNQLKKPVAVSDHPKE